MASRPDDHTLRASGAVKSVTTRSVGDQYGEVVQLTAEFEVYIDDPVAGDDYGLALEDAVRWLRLTLESAKPDHLAGLEAEMRWSERELERLSAGTATTDDPGGAAVPVVR